MAKGKPSVKPVAQSDITTSSKKKTGGFNWKNSSNKDLLYGKTNYILFALGFVMILAGFILMAGGGSDDPNVFDAEGIYATRRITVAPIVIISGFIVIAFGTLIKPKDAAGQA
jgi:hypothetical protein